MTDPMKWHESGSIKYRVRTSLRARNVRLTISLREGLTVVAPRGFDLSRVPAIVAKRRAWVETHLRRFAETAMGAEAVGKTGHREADALPDTLELPALGESWRIEYLPTNTRAVGALIDRPGWVTVYGAVHDHDSCREALKRWLRLRTREELAPWLDRLATENGFRFREALIRGQRTRWASCSVNGVISLSYKLLFLERHWVRCILLHELCHTVCMNHSPRFWALLGRHEPECREIQRRMRDSWKRVPAWVEERAGE